MLKQSITFHFLSFIPIWIYRIMHLCCTTLLLLTVLFSLQLLRHRNYNLILATSTAESPYTIRFSPINLELNALNVIAMVKRSSHLSLTLFLWKAPLGRVTISCLIVLSGDVEVNPGPCKYPCTMCSRPVRNNQEGVQCDGCDLWTHA